MKLAAARVAAFLRSPDPKARFVLLHGEDRGLVHERALQLARTVVEDPSDPFRVAELTPEDVRADPARLMDELQQLSLLGGRRVVFLRMEGEDISARLQPVLDAPPAGDTLLIVEAGELSSRSPVRRAFEAADAAVAIPCYADNEASVAALIEQTFAPLKIALETAARDFLLAHLGSDRLVTRTELDKLALYALGKTTITLDDAIAAVGDSAALSVEAIAFAAAAGDGAALDRHIGRAFREGQSTVAVLRACLRHFHRLHLAAGYMQQGRSAGEAIKSLRPPVIFLQEEDFLRQLRIWSAERLRAALALLAEAERDCKSTGIPDEAACHRALMRIALAAHRAPART